VPKSRSEQEWLDRERELLAHNTKLREELREAQFEFNRFMEERREWALKQFPTQSCESVCRHIEKELTEIRACNTDLVEWIDVVLLAMEGYCRSGGNASDIFSAMKAKHAVNLTRKWQKPNGDEPIEHVREPAMIHHKFGPSTDVWTCVHGVAHPDKCEACK
jgi:hypothetical protein